MKQLTVIVHGWSDCSDSFVQMKKFLQSQGIGGVKEILYADYESREDHVTYNDVIDGLNDQFVANGIIDADGKKLVELNVIVHSTGGLVIRQWIHNYYYVGGRDRIDQCPVKRIVMLAPANFGSPLAHRGKSFLGSLFKGRWKMGDFLEVGRHLLEGLELGSPHQWWLAHRDLIIDKPYYNADQIQLTILVGVQDYTGLRGWVNKPGTDGTVVIAGTSLDSAKIRLDFSKDKRDPADGYTPFEWEQTNPPDDFAFAALEGLDHGSIVGDVGVDTAVGQVLLRALGPTTPKQFEAFRKELEAVTEQTYAKTGKDRFQQFILHAVDEFGVAIPDFTIEFFIVGANKDDQGLVSGRFSDKEMWWSDLVNRQLLGEVHTHSVNPSYRRLLVNVKQVKDTLSRAAHDLGKPIVLSMRLYVPDVDRGIRYDVKSLQNIVLYDPQAPKSPKALSLFYENTTTLVEMCVNRLCEYVTVGSSPRKH